MTAQLTFGDATRERDAVVTAFLAMVSAAVPTLTHRQCERLARYAIDVTNRSVAVSSAA